MMQQPDCFLTRLLAELGYTLLRHPRRKRLAIQVRDARVVVRATLHCSRQKIDAFVCSQQDWIQHQLRQQRHAMQQLEMQKPQDGVILLDREIPLQCLQAKVSGYHYDGSLLRLYAGNRVKPERQAACYQQQLALWYQQQAELWMKARLGYWQQQMGVSPQRFYLKSWRRRWGCCHSDGRLGLNWHLIKAPAWVIDYVLVHELAHLTWMSHCSAFWQRVHQFYPQPATAKAWLQQHQWRLLSQMPAKALC